MSIRLADCKSTVKSQHGEDGVIAAVFREIGVSSRTCVEFGAYDMQRLSNVFPLWTNGWKCLLIEGDAERYRKLVSDFAAYPGSAELRVSIANGYVQEAGANSLDNILSKHEFPTDLDLVSIDVDGTDFHIWRGLRRYRPRLVIVEYNPMIPHHIDIVGSASGNDIGCSVRSLARLGKEKGYSLVACIGWNAFFVSQEHAHLFDDADNLDALFDASYVRYAIQSYNGEVFFSAPLHLGYQPFLDDSDEIEFSSVTIGRLGDDLLFVTRRAAWRYAVKAKRLLVGRRSRPR